MDFTNTSRVHALKLKNGTNLDNYLKTFRSDSGSPHTFVPRNLTNKRNNRKTLNVVRQAAGIRETAARLRREGNGVNAGHQAELEFIREVVKYLNKELPRTKKLFSEEILQEKKVPELKNISENLGLRKTGTKDRLIRALLSLQNQVYRRGNKISKNSTGRYFIQKER